MCGIHKSVTYISHLEETTWLLNRIGDTICEMGSQYRTFNCFLSKKNVCAVTKLAFQNTCHFIQIYVIEKVLCVMLYSIHTDIHTFMSTHSNSSKHRHCREHKALFAGQFTLCPAPLRGRYAPPSWCALTTLQIRRKNDAAPLSCAFADVIPPIAKLDELAAERGITRTLLAREISEIMYIRVLITQKSVTQALTKVTLQTIKQFDSDLQDIRHGIEILLQKN